MKALYLFLICITAVGLQTYGQVTVSGRVVDDQQIAQPGVTVQVKNTLRGTITDGDGNYSLTVQPSDTLIFSMVGMATQVVPVNNQSQINITLAVEMTTLDEVVVVGYGTQRVKDLTAPVVTVKGSDLARQVTPNAMQALQGKVPGLQIINTGVPGSGPTVKIRGVGSIGDYANPLYVVDGVFVDNIDFLGASDIEDITVLKDASAAAIYGVRAANGVILVTTRKGSFKPSISYDGYYGLQIPVDILPMANKNQYVELFNEANANITGFVPRDPNNYPASTDWYQKLVRNAPMTSHSLDISGGENNTSYAFGGSYVYQEGIMDSKNDYSRYNLRGRLDQNVNQYIKIGLNVIITNFNRYNPNQDAFFGAYVNPPVYPVYNESNSDAYPVRFDSPQRYGFGNQYGNPVAASYYNDSFEKGNKVVFNAYTEIYPIKDKLTLRVSYNQDLSNYMKRDFEPEFNVGGSQGVRTSSLTKEFGNSNTQILDNTITFRDQAGQLNYSILLGQSSRLERSDNMTGFAKSVPGLDNQSKYLSTGSFLDRFSNDDADKHFSISYFTRGTLNYADKYLATLTFRADGSQKFQKKWGYFPSVGLGWNLTREGFMENQQIFSYLKVRASWGLLGNANVPANSSVVIGQTGAGSSGVFGDRLVPGIGAQTVIPYFMRWEVVNEFDVGIDFTLNNDKLSGELDLYRRVTNDVIFFTPIATGGGVVEQLRNNGTVLNAGIELTLKYSSVFANGLRMDVGFNATTIKNEVLELQGRDYIPGAFVRGNYTTRTAVGHPIGSFYGYEIAGVYESESEALLDPVSQTIKNEGFFKYKDQNDDDIVNENDKVYLGSPIPWLISGIDLSFNYKMFDLNLSFMGQLGNKILNAKRMNRDIFADGNYDRDIYENRWTEENLSDKYPSAAAYNYSFIQQANDFFVENGSFVRIQNIQAGYTTSKIKFIPQLRIYISAQRPFTFFTYKGFTPEIGGTPISSGVDNSVYPMQAIYTIGLKANF
ncbi:MAG TPA: TonB-dependent receptor [Bacteroidales bacterium]|jgi:TonB-linked SusC/RagA family outer membrane protein|nr:TonB-dependent receptor [Bacteroidales bacterium]